ncbi:MAG: DNA-binding domain-containing protein [Ignavibacteria bacterium]|jgi:hypothetical protein
MSIKYSLRPNHLTADPDDYMASVTPLRTAELNDVIQRMIERGSTVTKPDIVGVFADFQRVLEDMLAEGSNVNLPFANFTTSLKGVFVNDEDTYDPARHKLYPALSAGVELKDFYDGKMTVEKVKAFTPMPLIEKYVDLVTGEVNSIITAGGMGQLKGDRLKFDSEAEDEGIYITAADNTETKVTTTGVNKPQSLMFMLPASLTTGEYRIEVRARIGTDELRSGRFTHTLSVV